MVINFLSKKDKLKMSCFKSVRDCKGKMRVGERKKKERWAKRERETDTETENLSETLRYFRDP